MKRRAKGHRSKSAPVRTAMQFRRCTREYRCNTTMTQHSTTQHNARERAPGRPRDPLAPLRRRARRRPASQAADARLSGQRHDALRREVHRPSQRDADAAATAGVVISRGIEPEVGEGGCELGGAGGCRGEGGGWRGARGGGQAQKGSDDVLPLRFDEETSGEKRISFSGARCYQAA